MLARGRRQVAERRRASTPRRRGCAATTCRCRSGPPPDPRTPSPSRARRPRSTRGPGRRRAPRPTISSGAVWRATMVLRAGALLQERLGERGRELGADGVRAVEPDERRRGARHDGRRTRLRRRPQGMSARAERMRRPPRLPPDDSAASGTAATAPSGGEPPRSARSSAPLRATESPLMAREPRGRARGEASRWP